MFRWALDCLAKGINEEMKMAVVQAIAGCIPYKHLQPEYIISSAFNQEVVKTMSKAVIKSTQEMGIERKRGRESY